MGLPSKAHDLYKLIEYRQLDIVFVCETWTRQQTRWPDTFLVRLSSNPSDSRTGHCTKGVAFFHGQRFKANQFQVVFEVPGIALIISIHGIQITGVYLPPSMTTTQCCELLESLLRHLAPSQELIFMGDLNMRLGELTGDRISNSRKVLHDFLLSKRLVVVNSPLLPPTFLDRSLSRSSTPDYIYVSRNFTVKTTSVLTDIDLDSDHRMLITKVSVENESNDLDFKTRPNRTCWKIGKLKCDQIVQQYGESIAGHLKFIATPPLNSAVSSRQNLLDTLCNDINVAISKAAHLTIGRKQVHSVRRMIHLTSRYLELKARKKTLFRELRSLEKCKLAHLQSYRHLVTEYKHISRMMKKEYRVSKDISWKAFCHKTSMLPTHEQLKVMKAIKNKHVRQRNLLKSDADSLESHRQFFQSQFQRQAWQPCMIHSDLVNENGDLLYNDLVNEDGCLVHDDLANENGCVAKPPAAHDTDLWLLKKILLRAPSRKASGYSGIPNELLKYGGFELTKMLGSLFSMCISWSLVPSCWRSAIICPVHKKNDPGVIENYRPISLLEHVRKLFECYINEKFLLSIIEPLSIHQGGFRRGRSTLDQAACLHEAIIQFKDRDGHYPLVAYLDIKAAYDSVDRAILWRKLRKKGADEPVICLLKSLYENCKSKVAVDDCLSEPLDHEMGIMQGSVISPLLYCLFLDDIGTQLSHEIASEQVNLFLYADDIALVCSSSELLESSLKQLEDYSIVNNFRFSPAKCEVVCDLAVRQEKNFELYNVPLPFSDVFKYLGIMFNAQGIDETLHIKNLVQKARSKLNMMKETGYNAKGFAEIMKRSIYCSFIRSNLEYGLALMRPCSETWREVEEVQLDATRVMSGMPRNSSKAALREFYGLVPMKIRQIILQANWLAHGLHSPASSMLRKSFVTHLAKELSASVFGYLKENPVSRRLEELLNESMASDNELPSAKEFSLLLNQAIDEVTAQELDDWRQSTEQRQLQAMTLGDGEDAKRRLRSIACANLSYDDERILKRWLLRRAGYGVPPKCRQCSHRTSVYHLQECCGVDIDGLCRAENWEMAAHKIRQVINRCCPEAFCPLSYENELKRTLTILPNDWGGGLAKKRRS